MTNGMKSGSGENPFEDLDTSDDEEEVEEATEADESPVSESKNNTESSGNSATSTSLPWKYARENVKSDRDMVQFYLQQETKAIESQAESDLEAMLGESVLTFDLREAAYRVALQQHLDDVADHLREWGYDVE